MLTDLRHAFRLLIKSPAFSLIAIATLALGIGANTAIFSVVEGTLLRPLPFPNADRLVRVYEAADDNGARGSSLNLSEQTVQQWREHGVEIFEGLAAATGINVTVGASRGNSARTVQASRISANFLSVLGLPPALGRNFTAEEDQAGGAPVAIISDDFWKQYLGGQPNVLGITLTLDGVPHTIVGVMPKTFRHPYRADLWVPLTMVVPAPGQPINHYLYGVARLRPNVTVPQATEAVRRMCASINQAAPNPNNARAAYMPALRESFVMDLRPKILVIVGAAWCALLIAAANFAGLLLTRVIEREGEFALRAALGASWIRLFRQQIIQALVLAIVGTLVGLLMASWITPALVAMSPEGTDATASAMREFDNGVRFDWPIFGVAAGGLLFVGLGFGLIPAIRASRTDLRGAMSSTARGSTLDRSARRLLGSLVVTEFAVAAALLIASAAAAQYFRQLINEPWGFSTDRRTAFNIALSDEIFPSPVAKQQALDRILTELRTIPGVRTATVTGPSPMNASRDLMSFTLDGVRPPEPQGYFISYLRATVPDYFKHIGEPLLQGRDFLETDTADSPPVCILSQSFVRRFWPNEDPIGKRVKWGRIEGARPWLTVVGVVGDMKAIADPRDGEVIGMIVRPMKQLLATNNYRVEEITSVVETESPRTPIEAVIRAALTRVDPRLAAYEIVSLDEGVARSRVTERFVLTLVSIFGALGLVLAAIGLYGLLSLHVARRQREFGIRSALGATAAQIVRLIARQGATLIGIGFVAGGIVTSGVIRVVRNQWEAMPAPTVTAWLVTAVVLGGAAFVACWLPARKASRIDPVIALRSE
jgi:putative ABC transport system permease protein